MYFSHRNPEKIYTAIEEWTDKNKIEFSIELNSGFQDYVVDMKNVGEWKGILNQLRIDFQPDISNGVIEIDAIELWDELAILYRS